MLNRKFSRGLGLSLIIASMFLASCSKSGKGTGADDGSGGLDGGNIPVAGEGSILKDVNFDYDSSALSGEASKTLSSHAQWLGQNKSSKVVIEGHCDERGTVDYNLALGERRAKSVFDYLKGVGVSQSRMSTQSYGEELPLDPRHSEVAWAKNRRAHFVVE